jgi:hypothetical protein
MEEEKIQEILKDPNTWCWDGCTYPDTDHYGEDFKKWMQEYVEQFKHEDKDS